jgi:hypothetical protein
MHVMFLIVCGQGPRGNIFSTADWTQPYGISGARQPPIPISWSVLLNIVLGYQEFDSFTLKSRVVNNAHVTSGEFNNDG